MRRISSDYEQIMKDFANHKNIVVEPLGDAPAERYRVTYYVNGIYLNEDGSVGTLGKHIVIITLHSEYPRYKPVCNIATPIWHPNFRDGQICIGDIWGAGESLSDIIVNIGDMIQYKSWNSFSPLSAEAAEWAIENKEMFPVGNINLWTGEEEDGTVKKDFDIDLFDENGEIAQSAPEAPVEEVIEEQFTPVAAVEEKTDENDIEITAEDLEGIEFVPTSERMQSSRYGATAKGGKVNFKTVLIKGLLWALIGAFLGFGVSELMEEAIDEGSIAKMCGHTELAEYYEYTDEADEILEPVNKAFEKYCKQNGIDSEGDDALLNWLLDAGSQYRDEVENYFAVSEKADYALYEAYEMEFNSNSDKLADTMKNILRLHTALWSAIIALFIGLFLGIGEGIYYGSSGNTFKYAMIGMGVSIGIGAVSGYLAQWMYSTMLTENSSDFTSALVRGLGWAIMGIGIGLAIGLIKPGGKRILFCSLGGVIGAFSGGFLFNYICDIIPGDIAARGIAIVIMGLLIGVGVGLLEQFAKSAWLKVIRGEFEGKEYLVFTGTTSIGNSGKNTIVLFKDKLIAPNHCDIVQEGTKYVLVDKGTPMGTVVNGMRINRHVLRQGDSIAIGNTVLIFNTK